MATTINKTLYSNSKTIKSKSGAYDAYVFSLEVIENSYDIETNKSNVTINEYAYGINNASYSQYWTVPLNFNTYDTKTQTTTQRMSTNVTAIPKYTKTLIGTWTGDLEHKDDGSLALNVTTTYTHSFSQSYLPAVPVTFDTGTLYLTTIPRASEVACTDFVVASGNNATISIGRKVDSFTHTLTYQFGSLSGTIATKTNLTTVPWSYPVNDFYSEMANTNKKQGTITCKTYNGNTLVGTTTCNFNASVETKPTISSVAVYDNNSVTRALTSSSSNVVKYASSPRVTVTASPPTGTTIASYRFKCGDYDITQQSNIFNLTNIVNSQYEIYAIDARGNLQVYNGTFNLIEYIKLDFINTETNFKRLNSASSTIKLNAKGYYFNSSFGRTSNTLTMKYRYKEKGTGSYGSYTTVSATITKSDGLFNVSTNISGSFSYQKAYEFELVIIDKVNTSGKSIVLTVTSGETIIKKYKDRIDVGGGCITFKDTILFFDDTKYRQNSDGSFTKL